MPVGDRLITHTVHTDDGATELYWARGADDMLVQWEGSLLFHDDGGVTWKGWTDDERPIVVHIRANRVLVAETEDQPPDAPYVYDSAITR